MAKRPALPLVRDEEAERVEPGCRNRPYLGSKRRHSAPPWRCPLPGSAPLGPPGHGRANRATAPRSVSHIRQTTAVVPETRPRPHAWRSQLVLIGPAISMSGPAKHPL
jgi:hypothetical protein